jgi:hypothetical protein
MEEGGRTYFKSAIHNTLKGKGDTIAEIKNFGNCPKFQTLYASEPLYETFLEKSNRFSISDDSTETLHI